MILGKPHVSKTKITFDLLDPGAVVYHPNYFILCERARSEAFEAIHYPLSDLWHKEQIALAVREAQLSYHRPLRINDEIAIFSTLEDFTGASLGVKHQILSLTDVPGIQSGFLPQEFQWDEKKVLFQAVLRLVAVSLEAIKTTRLPEKLKSALQLNPSL
ncbi:MAG: acyl-CoA thioesterase [Bdellovibrionia bacterium]